MRNCGEVIILIRMLSELDVVVHLLVAHRRVNLLIQPLLSFLQFGKSLLLSLICQLASSVDSCRLVSRISLSLSLHISLGVHLNGASARVQTHGHNLQPPICTLDSLLKFEVLAYR